jgi:hypothetical protein
MRRITARILAIFVGFLAIAAIAAAEEFPLQSVNRPVIPGETRCLPFFITTSFGGKATERIIFWYKDSSGKEQREMKDKSFTAVEITEEAKTPAVKVSEDGQGFIFKVNRAEYDKSRACLPQEQTKPTQ